MNIYISNLDFNTSDSDLRDLFSPFGEVSSAKVVVDRETGRCRGFGFVEMSDDAASKDAINKLNETDFLGRTVRVSEAKPKEDRPQKSFGPNSYGNKGGGGGYKGGNDRGGNKRW